MFASSRPFLSFAAVLCFIIAASVSAVEPHGVRLSEVDALTFREGKLTEGRRTSPLPQLRCVGCSDNLVRHRPQMVQCRNQGLDDRGDVQWDCEADLDPSVSFGVTTVSCEGFAYPGDKEILPGSCALEYSLVQSAGAAHNQFAGRSDGFGGYQQHGTYKYDPRAGRSGYSMISSLLIFGIFAIIIGGIYTTLHQRQTPHADAARSRPPPFNPAASPNHLGGNGYASGFGNPGFTPGPTHYGPTNYAPQVHGGGWLPGLRPGNWGFGGWAPMWMIGGGLLGSLWNRTHTPAPNVHFAQRNRSYGSAGAGFAGGGSSMGFGAGGGSNNGTRRAHAYASTESR